MRTDFVTESAVTDSNMSYEEEYQVGVSQEALVHVAYAFSNIYNDPILAVIREYIANAMDAVRGTDGTIEVIAPTNESPVFVVRDTGSGMSRETVTNILTGYFQSTKNSSSTEIGGWGIGIKSALAITNQFYITTTKDDVTVKAQYAKADFGVPTLKIISTVEGSGKPNGTSVSIPIEDVSRFRDKLYQFAYFQNAVDIQYTNFFPPRDRFDSITVDEDEKNPVIFTKTSVGESKSDVYIIKTKGHYDEQNEGVYVVMGGIFYYVDEATLKRNLPLESHPAISAYASSFVTVIDAPIDSVVLSPNREGVQFVDKTREFFEDIFSSTYPDFVDVITKEITDAPTYPEAVRRYGRSGVHSSVWKATGLPTWNGIYPIYENIDVPDTTARVLHYEGGNHARCYSRESIYLASSIKNANVPGRWGSEYTPAEEDKFGFMLVLNAKSSSAAQRVVKDYADNVGYKSLTVLYTTVEKDDDGNDEVVTIQSVVENPEALEFSARHSYYSYVPDGTPFKTKMTFADVLAMFNVKAEDVVVDYDDILAANRKFRAEERKRLKEEGVTQDKTAQNSRRSRKVDVILTSTGINKYHKSIGSILSAKPDKVFVVNSFDYAGYSLVVAAMKAANMDTDESRTAVILADENRETKTTLNAVRREFPEAKWLSATSMVKTFGNPTTPTKAQVKEAYIMALGTSIRYNTTRVPHGSIDSDKIKDPIIRKAYKYAQMERYPEYPDNLRFYSMYYESVTEHPNTFRWKNELKDLSYQFGSTYAHNMLRIMEEHSETFPEFKGMKARGAALSALQDLHTSLTNALDFTEEQVCDMLVQTINQTHDTYKKAQKGLNR